MKISNGMRIASAKYNGNDLTVETDSGISDTIWLYRSDYCSTPLVLLSDDISDAYELAMNLSETIPESELFEAYGFDCEAEFQAAVERQDDLDLSEGFQYQSNSTGTGIVSICYTESLIEYEPDQDPGLEIEFETENVWVVGMGHPGCLYDHTVGPVDTREAALECAREYLEQEGLSKRTASRIVEAVDRDGLEYLDKRLQRHGFHAIIAVFEADRDDWKDAAE